MAPTLAHAQSTPDLLMQQPQLKAPERGSVVGSMAGFSVGPSELSRGTFSLGLPIALAQERGGALFNVVPTYSPEGGISEWGMGFSSALSITRYRPTGELGFDASDEYTSPWGRLRQGIDGKWYPIGLSSKVRLEQVGDDWKATLPDGTVVTFAQRVSSSRGIYAWYATRADSILGARTVLSYTTNASGRPFLSSVTYGSQGFVDAHRVRFEYEGVPYAFEDYRSGAAQTLDQRIKRVVMETRSASSNSYSLRWTHDLLYRQDALGPAFYLERVTKRFPDGSSEPPVVYHYDAAEGALQTTSFQHLPELDQPLAEMGAGLVQPIEVSYLDADADGRLDLEHYYDMRLIHHTDLGWITEGLAPAPPDVYTPCRPSPSIYNLPRHLVKMVPSAAEPQVLHTEFAPTGQSSLTVCNRVGQKLSEYIVDGDWTLDHATRIADLDHNRRPDFVRFTGDSYRVMRNTSDANGFSFGVDSVVPLGPSLPYDGHWVYDINGDGIQDLVARTSSDLLVWYGRGTSCMAMSRKSRGGHERGG